jgi:hypothetical protein
MAAVRSAPFTLLALAGVSVLKSRCSRLWEEDDGAGEDGDDEEEDDVDGDSDADDGNVDVSGSGDGPGADGATALSAAGLLPEARFSREIEVAHDPL